MSNYNGNVVFWIEFQNRASQNPGYFHHRNSWDQPGLRKQPFGRFIWSDHGNPTIRKGRILAIPHWVFVSLGLVAALASIIPRIHLSREGEAGGKGP